MPEYGQEPAFFWESTDTHANRGDDRRRYAFTGNERGSRNLGSGKTLHTNLLLVCYGPVAGVYIPSQPAPG